MSAAPTLVVIGGGPRGTGVIERIAANARELYGDLPLDIHLVDPYPAGGGRIWRPDQSPLLWMNSMAEDVTMFTDETVELAGPVVAGPALHAWAEDVRAGRVTPDAEPAVLAEIRGLTGQDFPSRRLQSAYLRWTYDRALAALPPGITVHEHRTTAIAVTGPRGSRQRVRLRDRAEPLLADLVVLTVGHLDAEQEPEQAELSDFAARHGLIHLPPDFTADTDLTALPAGEPVIVRGFGLAFIDLMVLLTEGRGGRHENGVYRPSGQEPVLYVGSRRGVPYHSKIGYTWTGERPPPPRYLTPAWADELLSRPGPLDFRRDVWPLVGKELGHAHYHRLFTAHPERTALDPEVFDAKYAAADPGSPELADLVAGAVPDPADRLDLDALDRPLDGVTYESAEALQEGLRDYITADLTRRHNPDHSADLAVFLGLLSAYAQLIRLGDIGNWWHGFFSYLASGPPGPRLEQLRALSRAASSASSAPPSPWRPTRSTASSGRAAPPYPASTSRPAPWSRPACRTPRSATPPARCCAPCTRAGPPSPTRACSPWTRATAASSTARDGRTRAASRWARSPRPATAAPSPAPAPADPRSGRTTPPPGPRWASCATSPVTAASPPDHAAPALLPVPPPPLRPRNPAMSLTSDPPIDQPAGAPDGPPPGKAADPGTDYGELTVVPARHPWRWVAVAVTAVLVAQFINGLVTNPGWEWDVFAQFFSAPVILKAVWLTLQLTFYGTVLGFALGIVLAFMRLSDSPFLRTVAYGYIWAFRSIPLIVQLLFWFNLAYLYKELQFGIPFGPGFFTFDTMNLVGAVSAAVLGLALHQAAYAAEIVRGGVLAVGGGQLEAAAALGIPKLRQLRRIVLPQAMRSILPNAANEIISLFKGTSIVSVMAIGELFYQVQVVYGRSGRVVPMLMVATAWYILLTTALSIIQYYVERHYAKGAVR